MIVLIIVVIIFLTLIVGLLLAAAVVNLDKAVVTTTTLSAKQSKSYNPAATLGHKLPVQGEKEEVMQEARVLAAKQAAAMPRGANMRIGNLREQAGQQPTAFDGLQDDPLTAVKIASVHGWDAVRLGMAHGAAPAAAPAQAAAAAPAVAIPEPEYITITDDMDPAEARKARIANAKAKSAYNKALKEAGATPGAAAATAPQTAPAAPQAAAPQPAAAAGVPEPEYVTITDDMSPDETRKARIANSKAKAAYNKALKAAGVDPAAVSAAPPAPVPQAPAAPPAAAAPAADLSGVPKPDLVEISDDMSPDEIRKARIANAKATSAYKKALKAAGIDPSTVEI